MEQSLSEYILISFFKIKFLIGKLFLTYLSIFYCKNYLFRLIDFSNLVQYEKELSPTDKEIDVLNGIAFDKTTGK